MVYVMVWRGDVCLVGWAVRGARLCWGVVAMQLVRVAVVLGHQGVGVWGGRGRGGGAGVAMSPRSARMVVLAWCGRVWAVVAGWAARLGCCGTVVMVGAGGYSAVGVPRGSGRGVVRCGWTGAPGWGVAPCWQVRWRAP